MGWAPLGGGPPVVVRSSSPSAPAVTPRRHATPDGQRAGRSSGSVVFLPRRPSLRSKPAGLFQETSVSGQPKSPGVSRYQRLRILVLTCQ